LKNIIIIGFLAGIFHAAKAAGLSSFKPVKDSLSVLLKKMMVSKSDAEKTNINLKFLDLLRETLKDKDSHTFPFDSLKKHKILIESAGKECRILNWCLRFSDETYKYFGFVQYLDPKTGIYYHWELKDRSTEIKNPENAVLNPDKWYGAYYSAILTTKDKKSTLYTLIGWDGNNRISQKKILESMSIHPNGNLVFGLPVFEVEKEMGPGKKISVWQKRVIFEYKQGVFMALKFHPEQDRIVLDHLGPPESIKSKRFHEVGPDFSYDAYEWKKGKWKFLSMVDVKNDKTGKEKKFNDPEGITLPPGK
jgi:hypothetical protein